MALVKGALLVKFDTEGTGTGKGNGLKLGCVGVRVAAFYVALTSYVH